MKKVVLILLANLSTLVYGDCVQTVNESHSERISKYERFRTTYSYTTIIDSIKTTCEKVNFPVEPSKNTHLCEKCPGILRINSSNSTSVVSSSFLEYPNTRSLFLENLFIDSIAPGAFNALQSLEDLHLSGNHITKINIGMFNSLFNLKLLDLSRNKIKVLEPQCFSGMRGLQFFNVSANDLSRFDDIVFDAAINLLVSLDLSSNKITELHLLSVISKIENLSASDNKLDKLYVCPTHFQSFDMSRNLISSIENPNCNKDYSILKKLNLSYNKISCLNTSDFSGLASLERLDLCHNNISQISIGSFSKLHALKYLNLSHNNIRQFQNGLFESTSSLQVLDINYNHLTDIRRYLHSLVNLTEIHLEKNGLSSLNSKELLEDLPKLSFVSIDGNNFSCDNLINIVHDFRKVNVTVPYGKTANNSTNVHGITCSDNENFNLKFEEIILDKLDKMSDQIVKQNAFYEYFNKDFKKSKLYEYMESLQKTTNDLKLNDTQIFRYLNEDFEKTNFFKYLEGIKDVEIFNKSFHSYFNSDFRNSSFVKYLDEMNEGFPKSNLYKFFNENFENTQFYKYFQSLRNRFSPNVNDTQFKSEIKTLLILMFVSMVVIIILLVSVIFMRFKKPTINHPLKNEQVELIEA